MALTIDEAAVRDTVRKVVSETAIQDIHTHIYTPRFGELLLWGIDELLTYHYLVAEVFRVAPRPYGAFWAMSKAEQAQLIWDELFIKRSPVSEACRGVLTVLHQLGLDVSSRNLADYRDYFAKLAVEDYVTAVFEAANVRGVIMTNDPFDDVERPVWEASGAESDSRFAAALRIDPLLNQWQDAVPRLTDWGYSVNGSLGEADIAAVRRFLDDWIARMQPRYLAVSLPPSFRFPEDSPRGRLIAECILPVTREAGIPFAMMIGVKKLVNPGLVLAGDAVGKSDIDTVDRLCVDYPENHFLVTMLSRENQHELCISARKFYNLHIFGCWWFLNNPSIIDEMTRERLELLGLSVTPQHSDARVLDQLIYKWAHSRDTIGGVLADKYIDILRSGWEPTEEEIRRDVALLFGGAFEAFCERAKGA